MKNGRFVVVEIKTGSAYRHVRSSTKLVGYPEVWNCMLSHHQIQVSLGRFLLAKTLDSNELDYDVLLLYVNNDGTIDAYDDTNIAIPKQTSEKVQKLLLDSRDRQTCKKRRKKVNRVAPPVP